MYGFDQYLDQHIESFAESELEITFFHPLIVCYSEDYRNTGRRRQTVYFPRTVVLHGLIYCWPWADVLSH